jgi:hypothetical protein
MCGEQNSYTGSYNMCGEQNCHTGSYSMCGEQNYYTGSYNMCGEQNCNTGSNNIIIQIYEIFSTCYSIVIYKTNLHFPLYNIINNKITYRS